MNTRKYQVGAACQHVKFKGLGVKGKDVESIVVKSAPRLKAHLGAGKGSRFFQGASRLTKRVPRLQAQGTQGEGFSEVRR